MRSDEIDPVDLRSALENMDDDHFETLTELLTPTLLDLEADDFFGTEGINKRLA